MAPGEGRVRMVDLAFLIDVTNVLLSITLLGALILAIWIGRKLGSDVITAVLYLRKTTSMRAAGAIVLGTGLVFLAQSFEFLAPELHEVAETFGLALILAGVAVFVAILRSAARKTPVVKLTVGEMPE